ncbi:C40 family peptidase [Enterococcus sp. HY326]|uniref:C40 family peptidase n=1 Tax=Enterococcus sp. HY326 TaxID=2971265 RepID=UPI0022404254|nr:C40 family peptidase [Enterococcus sp. HY326]
MRKRKNLKKSMSIFLSDSVSGHPKLIMLSQDYRKRATKNDVAKEIEEHLENKQIHLKENTFALSLLNDSTQSAMTGEQRLLIETAGAQLGKPYILGASGPLGFDCSGLAKYVFQEATNINLPMGVENQKKLGRFIPLEALQPGDLLFFGLNEQVNHVGIYIGDELMIHATDIRQVVTMISLEGFTPSFAKRLLIYETTEN